MSEQANGGSAAVNRAKQWQIALFPFNNAATNVYFAFYTYFTYYALMYLTGSVGTSLAGTVVSGALALGISTFNSLFAPLMRVFDGITDPVCGGLMDRTATKIGKFRPFMIVGNCLLALSLLLMMVVFRGIPDDLGVLRWVAYIVSYIIYVIGYTAQCACTKAGQTCLTNDPKQRSQFVIWNMIGMIGSIVLINVMAGGVLTNETICPKGTIQYEVDGVMQTLRGAAYGVQFYNIMVPFVIILSAIYTTMAVAAIAEKDRPEFWGVSEKPATFKDYVGILKNNTEIRRHITNSAVKTATTQTSAVHTAQSQVYQAASSTATTGEASEANINNDVHTGGSSAHTDNSFTVGAPLQDGVIADGGGVSAPAASMENAPPAGLAPDGMPPQEGVILTGSEAHASILTDPAPLVEGAQPDSVLLESMPVDMTPPAGGVVITGGDTAVNAVQTDNIVQGSPAGLVPLGNSAGTGGQHTQTHTDRTSQTVFHSAATSERSQTSHYHSSVTARPTLGGMVFSHSLASGGSFANDVIGTVARGEVGGSITGDMAAQSLQSYLGYTAQGSPPPVFTDTEIGRGRITGQVATPEHPQPIAFGLYHTEQYAEPKGEFTKIRSADGTLWYSQMAQDTVERKPYKAPDGTVAYQERIVKKLPDPPKRKDRI